MLTDKQVKVLLDEVSKRGPHRVSFDDPKRLFSTTGVLNLVFDRDDIRVEWQAGIFKVKIQYQEEIYLEGTGMSLDEAVESAIQPDPAWLVAALKWEEDE